MVFARVKIRTIKGKRRKFVEIVDKNKVIAKRRWHPQTANLRQSVELFKRNNTFKKGISITRFSPQANFFVENKSTKGEIFVKDSRILLKTKRTKKPAKRAELVQIVASVTSKQDKRIEAASRARENPTEAQLGEMAAEAMRNLFERIAQAAGLDYDADEGELSFSETTRPETLQITTRSYVRIQKREKQSATLS